MLCLNWVPVGQKFKDVSSHLQVTREGDKRRGNGVRARRKVGKENTGKGTCEI